MKEVLNISELLVKVKEEYVSRGANLEVKNLKSFLEEMSNGLHYMSPYSSTYFDIKRCRSESVFCKYKREETCSEFFCMNLIGTHRIILKDGKKYFFFLYEDGFTNDATLSKNLQGLEIFLTNWESSIETKELVNLVNEIEGLFDTTGQIRESFYRIHNKEIGSDYNVAEVIIENSKVFVDNLLKNKIFKKYQAELNLHLAEKIEKFAIKKISAEGQTFLEYFNIDNDELNKYDYDVMTERIKSLLDKKETLLSEDKDKVNNILFKEFLNSGLHRTALSAGKEILNSKKFKEKRKTYFEQGSNTNPHLIKFFAHWDNHPSYNEWVIVKMIESALAVDDYRTAIKLYDEYIGKYIEEGYWKNFEKHTYLEKICFAARSYARVPSEISELSSYCKNYNFPNTKQIEELFDTEVVIMESRIKEIDLSEFVEFSFKEHEDSDRQVTKEYIKNLKTHLENLIKIMNEKAEYVKMFKIYNLYMITFDEKSEFIDYLEEKFKKEGVFGNISDVVNTEKFNEEVKKIAGDEVKDRINGYSLTVDYWSGLEPESQKLVSLAETMFQYFQDKPIIEDFSPVIITYLKALEHELKIKIGKKMERGYINNKKETAPGEKLAIGQIAHKNNRKKFLKVIEINYNAKRSHPAISDEENFFNEIKELRQIRNNCAHPNPKIIYDKVDNVENQVKDVLLGRKIQDGGGGGILSKLQISYKKN